MSSTNIYYIYAYIRSKDSTTAPAGTPYYIGKGTGNRAFTNHHFKIPNDKSRIIILEDNLTEIGALALERRLIRWYGRKDLNTGILMNQSDGGDGLMNPSDETRYKIGSAMRGKNHTIETRNRISQNGVGMLGKRHSVESIKLMSESHMGIQAWNKGMRGFKSYEQGIIECPHCGKSGRHAAMHRWHLDNCKYRQVI